MTPGFGYWLSFLPIDVEHTHVIGGSLIYRHELEADGDGVRQELAAWMDVINAEDAKGTYKLQRSFGSRHAEPGPLSIKEGSLLDFHRYLARRLISEA